LRRKNPEFIPEFLFFSFFFLNKKESKMMQSLSLPTISQKISIKQQSLFDDDASFIEFKDGAELYDFFVKLDASERYMEELLDYKKTATRAFITIRFPRYIMMNEDVLTKMIEFFKQHLVDCGFVKEKQDILSHWAIDMSTYSEFIFRYVFDCGNIYFKSLELLQECLTLFKNRIFSDKKNSDLVALFAFKEEKNPQNTGKSFPKLKLFLETRLIDESILKNCESCAFQVRLFGHPIDKNVGFLSGLPGSKWQYMNEQQLQLRDIDAENNREFPLSREEFRHLLLSDVAYSKSPKIIDALKTIISQPISNTCSPMYAFYNIFYPFNEIWKMFGHPFREVNFAFHKNGNDMWKRKMSFTSVNAFQEAVMKDLPQVIHFGAIFDRLPSDTENRIIAKKELVFDVDLDSYYEKKQFIPKPGQLNVRSCCTNEKKACSKCWRLAKFASQFLFLVLTKVFGFDKSTIHFVFSGRRGMHCIVFDDRARLLTEKQRKAILLFFSKETAKNPRYPIIREIYARFADPLINIVLQEQDSTLKRDYFDFVEKNLDLPKETPVLLLLWPRFDEGVTTQLSHPLKSPGSLHPVTGAICRFFDPFSEFDPFVIDHK
jgi:DNA primase small subunit